MTVVTREQPQPAGGAPARAPGGDPARASGRLRRRAAYLARKAGSLPLREWGYTAQAQWSIVRAQTMVWRAPTGALVGSDHRLREADMAAGATVPPKSDRAYWELAYRLGDAVNRAARFGLLRPLCLVRALALQHLLRAHGIRAGVIRVGVRRSEGKFEAHAWVELGGRVLADKQSYVETYATLDDLSVVNGLL